MTSLDWGLVVLALALGIWGFRHGFVVGAFTLALAGGIVWMLGAIALHAPAAAHLRQDVQRSVVFRGMYDLLPPSGGLVSALKRVDPALSIEGPPAPVGPPNARIARDPDVRAAGGSVVRVLGTACGLGVEGSGWVAGPDLIVTNAHVVAGSDETTVETSDGTAWDADAVHYEPRNDLAVLRVQDGPMPLSMHPDPPRGAGAAVLGYPENGPLTISPARYGGEREVLSQDSYGRGPLRRTVSSLRGSVRSGNSGGPLIDARGRVLGTVFASRTNGRAGGFAVPNAIVRRALRSAGVSQAVDTGPCAAG